MGHRWPSKHNGETDMGTMALTPRLWAPVHERTMRMPTPSDKRAGRRVCGDRNFEHPVPRRADWSATRRRRRSVSCTSMARLGDQRWKWLCGAVRLIEHRVAGLEKLGAATSCTASVAVEAHPFASREFCRRRWR